MYKNSYLHDFVGKYIKEFFYSVLTPKIVVSTVPRRDLMIALSYLDKLSLQIRTRINRVMKNKLPYCNFWIIFRVKYTSINFFTIKDKITVFLRSGIVYKFTCRVASMLPIMAKLSAILKSKSVNTLEFLLLLEREWKGMTIVP